MLEALPAENDRSGQIPVSGAVEDLTVVIANLGSYRHLRPCLESIFAEDEPGTSYRVVVGFNGVTDDELPRRVQTDFPDVEWFAHPYKLGYCRAYNLLMERARGRYILVLDDDTVLPKSTLPGIVRFMDENPSVGIAGCRTVNPDGSYQKSFGLMFNLRSELKNVVRPGAFWPDDLYAGIDRWKEVGWLNGHFMAVRNEIIGDIGGLDEYYYTFQCEADWCLRIRRAGWKVAYAPDLEITHVGGQHSINSNVKSYTNLMRSHINRYYFFHKHYGTGAQFALRFVLSGAALLRLIRYAIVYALEPRRREEAVPKIRAYVKVLGLALKRRPHELPDYLRRENELATQCG